MIVKNEEVTLTRCLDSIKDIVDEIIIVDTGSEDSTNNIAKLYTNKVFNFKWVYDFSAARNYSFSKATKDYILWLDADDILLEEDRLKLLELKKTLDKNVDVVMMRYNTGFDQAGNVTMSFFRERLLKTENNYTWKDPVHEYINPSGNIINYDISITHKKGKPSNDRNLKIYQNMLYNKKHFTPRNLYYYANELYNNKQIDSAIRYYKKFLKTEKGWIEDNIFTCYKLSQCYKDKKNEKKQFSSLIKSLEYDSPRPEICCELGYFYKNKSIYDKAIFWFESALRVIKSDNNWSFKMYDSWGYIPAIELCVCYYKTNNVSKAVEYNNLAGEYKPDSAEVKYNRDFFTSIA